MGKKKLIRITTVPRSMQSLLQGQLVFMAEYYDIVAISSDGDCFEEMIHEQGDPSYYKVEMTRTITLGKDLSALFALIRIFRKEKPFIVHTHTPKAGTIGMWAAWIVRVPNRLHTVAGLPLLVATGKKRMLLDLVEKMTYAAATKVYPNSFRMRDIIEELHFTDSEKLKVIGNGSSNGIDTGHFSIEAVMANDELKKLYESLRKESVTTFGFVGRIVQDKGINELVRAFIRIYKRNSNTRLLLVGGMEEDLDPVEVEVKEAMYHHDGIQYVGIQSDVRPFMMAMDIFTFPSYREGFPNVVMQAGSLGLPQIVTDINGCNEIIEQGKNGIIIPVRDENALYEAMKDSLEHPKKYVTMAIHARERIVSRYDRQKMWGDLLEEYRSLEK